MKKKRRIFYFLKTKEEYDYMLLNNLIPKRGIVLIESTQEIYRNKVPYSGYSPLEENFNSLETSCKLYTDIKYNNTKELIELTKSSIKTDYTESIDKYKTKVSKLESKVSDLENQVLGMLTSLLNIEESISSLLVLISEKALIYNPENMVNLT